MGCHVTDATQLPQVQVKQFAPSCCTMSSEDEFDTIPDEFDGLDFDAIPDLAIIVPTETIDLSNSTIPTRPASANSSSRYSCDDDIDESFLVELDAIEGRLMQGIRESTNSP